jgi:uncharacterized protein (DUF305 family)
MERSSRRVGVGSLFAAIAIAGCSAATKQSVQQSAGPVTAADATLSPAARARADSGRPPYSRADVTFMQGMIAHHAQAVVMAGWAPARTTRRDVLVLCQRIDVAQRDEIVSMGRWLRQRHETVPEADLTGEHAGMPGMAGMLMPGMLTPEQMARLKGATGAEFDRLFLTFMIQHHQGALVMVNDLFDSTGAAQDDVIFKFASDVGADQTAEIDRMQFMLAAR